MILSTRALLALPPLLGVLLITRIGASRPEKAIVGKWSLSAPDTTIEMRADGTYEKRGWEMLYDYKPTTTPYSTVINGYDSVPTQKGRAHWWGKWRFIARDRIVLEQEGREVEGEKPPPVVAGRWYCGTPMLNYLTNGDEVAVSGDEARVAGAIWKRVE